MTDDDLKKRLRELATPAPNESARERAWHRARMAFASTRPEQLAEPKAAPISGKVFRRWMLPVAAAAAAVVLVAVMWPAGRPTSKNTVAWSQMLDEMEMLFPKRLNAVIERDGVFDIKLSDDDTGASAQPVIVELRRGSQVLRVLGFSGRRVCVDLGGAKACFEPLVTGEGTVILSGENFFWSPEHPTAPDGFRIQARTMPSA